MASAPVEASLERLLLQMPPGSIASLFSPPRHRVCLLVALERVGAVQISGDDGPAEVLEACRRLWSAGAGVLVVSRDWVRRNEGAGHWVSDAVRLGRGQGAPALASFSVVLLCPQDHPEPLPFPGLSGLMDPRGLRDHRIVISPWRSTMGT